MKFSKKKSVYLKNPSKLRLNIIPMIRYNELECRQKKDKRVGLKVVGVDWESALSAESKVLWDLRCKGFLESRLFWERDFLDSVESWFLDFVVLECLIFILLIFDLFSFLFFDLCRLSPPH